MVLDPKAFCVCAVSYAPNTCCLLTTQPDLWPPPLLLERFQSFESKTDKNDILNFTRTSPCRPDKAISHLIVKNHTKASFQRTNFDGVPIYRRNEAFLEVRLLVLSLPAYCCENQAASWSVGRRSLHRRRVPRGVGLESAARPSTSRLKTRVPGRQSLNTGRIVPKYRAWATGRVGRTRGSTLLRNSFLHIPKSHHRHCERVRVSSFCFRARAMHNESCSEVYRASGMRRTRDVGRRWRQPSRCPY